MLTREEFLEKTKCRDSNKISRLVLTNPQYGLPGEKEEVYELLRYIGSQLPREFDVEDLAEVVADLVNNLIKAMFSSTPEERLPDWMIKEPKCVIGNLGKITEIIGNVVEELNNPKWKKRLDDRFLKALKK